MATYISKAKKEELVQLEIIAEEAASGILIGGEFVGRGELLECDKQTASELIRRGRAKMYTEGSKKK
ncbi:hypothetical protein [Halodesulfovibrio aestuarii]|uniref:Uncharacterized protein n=1 Tax=Halodesulfovibrio aestuarii TaxID=126333 RepID=A0ABV4JQH9_9BACT